MRNTGRKQCCAALLLAGLLCLSGCAEMLDRSYQSVTPHTERATGGEDLSATQAETYQGLVNAILYCVTQGRESTVIRLTANYAGDVETDLEAACLEVAEDDPLGAYAVDYIKYNLTRIVSYYEAELEVTYRRTHEQVGRIITVTGGSAIRSELRGALVSFSPELTLRLSAFSEDEAYIEALLREAYDSTPAAALGMPSFAVTLYPSSGGTQRIVEIQLEYHAPADILRRQSAALTAASADLAARIPAGESYERLAALHGLLAARAAYRPDAAGNTAYAVLSDGGEANSEGFALAAALLGNAAGIRTVLVRGEREGLPHVWNIVTIDTGENFHMDSTASELSLLTDGPMAELGYTWDTEFYPTCPDPEPVAE